MLSRKTIGAAAAFIIAAAFAPAFGLEVARSELESADGSGIVFQNYSGPHTVINSAEQIRSIGSSLAPSVASNPDSFAKIGGASRYQIIHAVDPKETEKLDADILVIGSAATVDHVKNLRRIISAYLESAYKYSRRDADTIAVFATVYNAVYRGKMDNFLSKYKKIVVDSLDGGRVGLSTNYQEWPGATQIVIPLLDVHGGLSTVDSTEIADHQVIESLRGEDDMGIDARKGMADIKDREADSAEEEADDAQRKADEEAERAREQEQAAADANRDAAGAKKDASDAQRDADNAQKQADYAQKQADEAQRQADARQGAADDAQKAAEDAQKAAEAAQKAAEQNPDDAAAQAEADRKKAEAEAAQREAEEKQKQADAAQKQADERQATADQKQATADQKQATADQKQDDALAKQAEAEEAAQKAAEAAQKAAEEQAAADAKQAEADRKRTEAQEERDQIAKDQQELMDRQNVADENVLYGLKSVDEIGTMSAIVKMNSKNGELVKESPVSVIRSRTVFEDGPNFVAIAGTNFGNGAIKLVLIDKESLEISGESAEVLSETSVLVEHEGAYYCVVKTGATSFVVGKFNNNAQLLMKSDVPVKAATPITITKNGILVTASSGKPVMLSPKDMSAVTPDGGAK